MPFNISAQLQFKKKKSSFENKMDIHNKRTRILNNEQQPDIVFNLNEDVYDRIFTFLHPMEQYCFKITCKSVNKSTSHLRIKFKDYYNAQTINDISKDVFTLQAYIDNYCSICHMPLSKKCFRPFNHIGGINYMICPYCQYNGVLGIKLKRNFMDLQYKKNCHRSLLNCEITLSKNAPHILPPENTYENFCHVYGGSMHLWGRKRDKYITEAIQAMNFHRLFKKYSKKRIKILERYIWKPKIDTRNKFCFKFLGRYVDISILSFNAADQMLKDAIIELKEHQTNLKKYKKEELAYVENITANQILVGRNVNPNSYVHEYEKLFKIVDIYIGYSTKVKIIDSFINMILKPIKQLEPFQDVLKKYLRFYKGNLWKRFWEYSYNSKVFLIQWLDKYIESVPLVSEIEDQRRLYKDVLVELSSMCKRVLDISKSIYNTYSEGGHVVINKMDGSILDLGMIENQNELSAADAEHVPNLNETIKRSVRVSHFQVLFVAMFYPEFNDTRRENDKNIETYIYELQEKNRLELHFANSIYKCSTYQELANNFFQA